MIIKSIKKLISQHKTVPAPKVLEDDPWFGPAFLSDKQKEYVEMRKALEKQNQLISITEDKSPTKEVKNIHEVMYNLATKNGKTTTQLNPMPGLGGGSEQYQSGPGGWMSGSGF